MHDLVLKSQGALPVVNPIVQRLPVKIAIKTVYLYPEKFKIAEYLRDNPESSALLVSEKSGSKCRSAGGALLNMYYDGIVHRRYIRVVGVKGGGHYLYTIVVSDFKRQSDFNRLNEKEISVLKYLRKYNNKKSKEIAEANNIEQKNIFYTLRKLADNELITTDRTNVSTHLFYITFKGLIAFKNGGVYE